MNRIVLRPQLTSIGDDYALWCAEQGSLLREGRLDVLDRDNVAEEIEGLGRSQEDEIESRLAILLTHLLKWRFQPDGRSNSWRATIFEQRSRIARRIKQSPSLHEHPANALAEEYAIARLKAAGESGLDTVVFPVECPFAIADVLDEEWFPEAP